MNQKRQWRLLPQECAGSYEFNGTLYVTKALFEDLEPEEIGQIVGLIQARVAEQGGADYLQVLEDGQRNRIFAIDQISREMKASGDYRPEDNHWTLLWAWEY
ncbi:MAG: hypothetical protein RRB13_16175 [bacterium]|nr:hypothetical protein [bacterium]